MQEKRDSVERARSEVNLVKFWVVVNSIRVRGVTRYVGGFVIEWRRPPSNLSISCPLLFIPFLLLFRRALVENLWRWLMRISSSYSQLIIVTQVLFFIFFGIESDDRH
ncbi:hypothetical protein RchiOBHm_Chr5g0017261 [Rosa chinensis]|uniref:Transmembrane protein n=1 Tax=Rosa chinensis TaxID=74649 RepID=A0A2P6Q6E9_ROSCH|nr:hypothetical protein RchiOBHm_Chr5g0017261 [Rosa chinensis]